MHEHALKILGAARPRPAGWRGGFGPVKPPEPGGPSKRAGRGFARLVEVMDRLRDPGGCPWDREQTVASLRPYLLEEVHEVLEALEAGDPRAICDELGDLLLQIVFLSRIFREQKAFGIEEVADAITAKLIRRHPHVFGAEVAATSGEVLSRWEAHKRRERGTGAGALEGVSKALPALMRAHKLSQRAAQVGFDWDGPAGVRAKLDEELRELEQAREEAPDRLAEEMGDVLFAAASLARHYGLSAEEALQRANRRFVERFTYIEEELRAQGKTLEQATLEQMEALWRAAKES
ncbi:MAG TPA: nucleoside triphosphate pyrophosphohydrolase [Acidobacteriota bacterium]